MTIRRITHRVSLSLGFVLGLCFLGGAGGCSAEDVISNTIDCNDVCNRYKDCFDSDYDVSTCTEECEADASADDDKERRLEMCDACIDGLSCSETVFECASDCAGIVP